LRTLNFFSDVVKFNIYHPAIYDVIKILIETQSETIFKIATVEQGKKKTFIIDTCDVENKNSSNLLKYLEYVGYAIPL